MALRISVFSSPALQATILTMRSLDRVLAAEIRKQMRSTIDPIWRDAVRTHAQSPQEFRVLADTARASISDKQVTLRAGASGRALSGGARPPELVHLVEFGNQRLKNFRRFNRKGYVVYPAAAEVIPRIASLFVQTLVRTVHEQLEKGYRG